MKTIRSIHFVGIKGVGMAPLAVIAKEAGFVVSGSDIAAGFITDKMLRASEIIPAVGFAADNIGNPDMVITTGAHGGFDNPEVIAAKERQIPVMTQGEAVGFFMQGDLFGRSQKGISVTGTHGKTTTSAMIATLLQSAGLNPSWVIGTSDIPSLGVSGHFGKGEYFVAEADEYANEPHYDKTPKMLLQKPTVAVITNIEHDHPDLYPKLEDVYAAFEEFLCSIPQQGTIICNGDDPKIKKTLQKISAHVITYGFSPDNDYVLVSTSMVKGVQKVIFQLPDNRQGEFDLQVMGEHNGLNALAAYIIGEVLGLSKPSIQKGLGAFIGTKRRLEYIGQLQSGALLYDDYAHHPTEVEKSLKALKQKYPGKRIVCLFQPHTFSRTKLLFDQFIDSLKIADILLLVEIYPSAREENDPSISSKHLVDTLQKSGKEVAFAQKLENVVQYLRQKHFGEDSIIVTMGAGDIYTIANEILEHESAPSNS